MALDPMTEAYKGGYYSVALTARGRIAVLADTGDIPEFTDYDDLDAAARAGIPAEILARAADALGDGFTVELDI
jgi:hypothetical protein